MDGDNTAKGDTDIKEFYRMEGGAEQDNEQGKIFSEVKVDEPMEELSDEAHESRALVRTEEVVEEPTKLLNEEGVNAVMENTASVLDVNTVGQYDEFAHKFVVDCNQVLALWGNSALAGSLDCVVLTAKTVGFLALYLPDFIINGATYCFGMKVSAKFAGFHYFFLVGAFVVVPGY